MMSTCCHQKSQCSWGKSAAKSAVVFCFLVLAIPGSIAQEISNADAEYARVTMERAAKIVSRLGIEDQAKAERVQSMIAQQYRDLSAIHEGMKAVVSSASTVATDDQRISDVDQKRQATRLNQFQLHYSFLARLSSELNASQVDQVKDGLTYDVVPKTFKQYKLLHPSLSDEQQRVVHAWLIEAREHAMDLGSSDEKHQCFGKYKGKINNYLSAQGFDAKKAERDLKERQTNRP